MPPLVPDLVYASPLRVHEPAPLRGGPPLRAARPAEARAAPTDWVLAW